MMMRRQALQRLSAAATSSSSVLLATRRCRSSGVAPAPAVPTTSPTALQSSPQQALLRRSSSGAASPGLFRPTRVTLIPPQLMRLLIAGGAALLQVFLVAFQRESRRLKYESEATGTADGASGQRKCPMSGVEAMQVLGLDRSHPALFNEIQKAESSAAAQSSSSSHSTASALLPLSEGKAREQAKRNFERMFALAIKDENMFLAGKLSAAYRVCVDPMWDQGEEVEENQNGASSQK